MHHVEQDPLKEAQPIADAGALMMESTQGVRGTAATGGEHANNNDASAPLAPEEADRFAMAFRPSWEPLAPNDPAAFARPRVPSVGPRHSSLPPSPPQDLSAALAQDELLRLRGRRARSRSLALAAVSVLSFATLVYWGISSTTDGAEESAARALQAPPKAAEAEPAAPAMAESAQTTVQPALNSAPTGFTARLADPTQPAEAAQPAAQAEADTPPAADGDGDGDGVEQANAAQAVAAPDGQNQPAAAALAIPAVAAATPQVDEAEPALAAMPEAKPAPVAAAAPAAQSRPALVAATAEAKPVVVAAAPALKPAPVAAAPANKPAPVATASEAKPAPATSVTTQPAAKPAAEPSQAAALTKAAEPAAPAAPPLLVVRAVPEAAQLWLDGQRMSNPFDTRLPLGSKHKIEARQEGYESSSQTIRLESDARLTITLKREAPAAPPPASAPAIKVKPSSEGARGAGFVTSNPY